MTYQKLHKYVTVALIILSVVLIVLCLLLVRSYESSRRSGVGDYHQIVQTIRGGRRPIAPADAKNITQWMTFDFIDHVFHLPSSYLQGNLSITDPKYPNITLDRYARIHGLDITSFLTRVQSTVGTYLIAHPPIQ